MPLPIMSHQRKTPLTLRILVVDAHAAFRQALTYVLEQEPDFTVVAQAAGLADVRDTLQGVDVAIVELQLADGSGCDLVRPYRVTNPHGAVLILTASRDRRDYARAIFAGAAGVLHKSVGIDEIIDAVRRLNAGETLPAPMEVSEMLRFNSQHEQVRAAQAVLARLTKRERGVLQELTAGSNDKGIADHLHITTQTVGTHMVHILSKLGVDSRLQALVFAARYGAVTIS